MTAPSPKRPLAALRGHDEGLWHAVYACHDVMAMRHAISALLLGQRDYALNVLSHGMTAVHELDPIEVDPLLIEVTGNVHDFLTGSEGGTSDDLATERVARLIEYLADAHDVNDFPDLAGFVITPITHEEQQ